MLYQYTVSDVAGKPNREVPCKDLLRLPLPRPALLRQIVATRSLHRSSRSPTKVLTGQAELIVGEAGKARRGGYSAPKHNSDGLAVT